MFAPTEDGAVPRRRSWAHGDVRRLLKLFPRPHLIEHDEFALALRNATGAASARSALHSIVTSTFDRTMPAQNLLVETVRLCDFEQGKAGAVAAHLNVSVRTLFRLRAEAIGAIAQSVDRVLRSPADVDSNELRLAELVAEFDPSAALHAFEKRDASRAGKIAFDRAVSAMWSGAPADDSIAACDGPWRLLAQAARVRYLLATAHRDEAHALTEAIRRDVKLCRGPLRSLVEFELAEIDRRGAVREGDVERCAYLAARMRELASDDARLRALASIATAETAIWRGDVTRAAALLDEAESVGARMRDVAVLGRAGYARAGIALLRGDHAEAAASYRLAASAIGGLDGGFAARAYAYEARAAFMAGLPMAPPSAKRSRRVTGSWWVAAEVAAAHARHVMLADPKTAAVLAKKAMLYAQRDRATGALAYARVTLGIAQDMQGDAIAARRLFLEGLAGALAVGDCLLLWDLFDHPAIVWREIGPLSIDREVVETLDRFAALQSSHSFTASATLQSRRRALIRLALRAATQGHVDAAQLDSECRDVAWTLRSPLAAAGSIAHALPPRHQAESAVAQWLLPASQRPAFRAAYKEHWLRMLAEIQTHLSDYSRNAAS